METTIKTQYKGQPLHIHIRLSDPCKNGHNDFAITADLWRKGTKAFKDYQLNSCGCLHEIILKAKPSLKIFVDLHLSNEEGEPMYAVENGYYHLQGVRGEAAYNHTCTLSNFASYMRVTTDVAEWAVKYIHTKPHFIEWVDSLRDGWRNEAREAKQVLQQLIDRNNIVLA